jgi:hypothetical protein
MVMLIFAVSSLGSSFLAQEEKMASAVTRTRTSAISFFHFCIFFSVSFSQYLSSSISMAAIRQSYVYTKTFLRMAEVILLFFVLQAYCSAGTSIISSDGSSNNVLTIHFPALLKSIQMK